MNVKCTLLGLLLFFATDQLFSIILGAKIQISNHFRPEKLLKPTDIPQHVIDEKKSDKKTEVNSKSTESPTTEKPVESKNEPTKVETNEQTTKTNAQVPVSGKSKKSKKDKNLVLKKSKFMIPPEIAKTLTQKEREKMLKEIVVEAFVTAEARNHRAETNKWLRWKYACEEKQVNKWLEGNGVEDMGWAVGRRIYEKEEIEVGILTLFKK